MNSKLTSAPIKYQMFCTVGELKYLTLPEANRIWMADLFFTNEKESHFHKTFAPNSYVRIFPAGRILYSTRLSLTLNCPMNFQLFPFDRQNCPMRLSTCKCRVFHPERIWAREWWLTICRWHVRKWCGFAMERMGCRADGQRRKSANVPKVLAEKCFVGLLSFKCKWYIAFMSGWSNTA